MIVLLSSASRTRYSDDIIRILALPRGGQMQFRYANSWLSGDVRRQVPRTMLAGSYALVCYLADGAAAVSHEIVPVRLVRIIRAEQVGSSYIFTIEAQDFVSGLDDAAIRSAASDADRAQLSGPATGSGTLFAFTADLDHRPHRDAGLVAFEATALALSAHAPFNRPETAFYTVLRVVRLSAKSWFNSWPRPSAIAQGAFDLASGQRYECEVYCLRHYTPSADTPLPHLSLGVAATESTLDFASATRSPIDSKYDVKRFVFAAAPDVLRRVSGFNLFLTSDPTSEQGAQDITLPLIFRGSILIAALRALLIGIATAGPSMIAVNAAGKLNPDVATVVIALGVLAGAAAIFPSIRKA